MIKKLFKTNFCNAKKKQTVAFTDSPFLRTTVLSFLLLSLLLPSVWPTSRKCGQIFISWYHLLWRCIVKFFYVVCPATNGASQWVVPSAIRPFRSGLEQQETLLSLRYVKKLHPTFGLHRGLNVDLNKTFWRIHDFYKSFRHAKISYINIEFKNWFEGLETSKFF